jgi:aspartyl-tRNA synthetase
MAGFDRYFQIAPCFRDEDPRADRLPGEFYQLDIEMSFVEQEDVFDAMEPVIRGAFEEFVRGKPVTPSPWPRIPYAEAMRKYGSDKPDLRNPLVMQDVSEHFRGSGFKVFARLLETERNEVWAIPAPGGGQRTFADRMNSWAQGEGQPGLGYIFWRQGPPEGSVRESVVEALEKQGERNPAASNVAASDRARYPVEAAGPIAKNIGEERTEAIRRQLDLGVGDAAFFVAGDPDKFAKFAGLARTKVGQELKLVDEERFEFAWVVDFPMYEWDEEEKKVEFSHNPFSMPQGGLEALLSKDPLAIKAFQYDIACNGYELASGGIRNHRPEAMLKAFEIAGYGEETVVERFGGMYRAFQYGAPPHGGMAAGVDRIVMLLAGEQNLREVALFPMNQRAEDLLMGAPSPPTPKQLRELHVRVVTPEK